jgi:hypothetical protein
MNVNPDELINKLRQFDPVEPDELDRAERSEDASLLLERILSADPEPVVPTRAPARRRRPKRPLALAAVGAVAVGIALLMIAPWQGGGGSAGGDRLTDALNRAAAAAATAPTSPAAGPFAYLKTREMSVSTIDVERRSWRIFQATTREEWLMREGAGQMRIVAGPSRFIASSERAEWETAGRPNFLPLGFGPHTEVHWIARGRPEGRVGDLPTDPAALVVRLRDEARAEHGELPLGATTLKLIAEDLRDPAASSELRRALFEAARRIPGIRYLGERDDPEGRRGVAVGVADPQAGTPTWDLLIFDPETGQALATETVDQGPFAAVDPEGPTFVRATVFLDAQAVEPPAQRGVAL